MGPRTKAERIRQRQYKLAKLRLKTLKQENALRRLRRKKARRRPQPARVRSWFR